MDGEAAAAFHVELTARVHDDLGGLEGTFHVEGPPGWVLADPLRALPDPPSDLQLPRTFPGPVSRGGIVVTPLGNGDFRFVTTLPARFGPYGATAHGAFANGGWYPQLLVGEGLPLVDWEVHVTLPEGATGALGGEVGPGVLTFSGPADRVPLAVLPRARTTALTPEVTLLTRGRPSRRLLRELGAPEGRGVVVRAPLRRRLTADGPGLVYLSDRAFRLTPGLEPAHRRAVSRGLAAGLSALPDDFDRDFVGAATTAEVRGMDRVLGAFRWVPQVNWLLVSQRIPFWAETTGQAWPADPVVDDLSELYDPHWPGTAAVAAVADRHGVGGVREVAAALAAGRVSPIDLSELRRSPPVQDVVLTVGDDALTLERRVLPGASSTPVTVRLDGVDAVVELPPGPTAVPLPQPARRVSLDPLRHLPQTSRIEESWPPRWDATFAGWVDGVNLSQGQVWVGGQSTLRRWWNTHDLFLGSVYNSQSDLVGVRVGYLRKEGPLLDGITRPLRLRFDVGSALLNPSFSPTEGLAATLDTAASIAWDDRVGLDFPLRGQRVGAGVGAGGIPGSSETWTSANVNGLWVGSPHPRVAFAGRGLLSIARSPANHRLLLLGGDVGIRSVPALPACPAEGEACLPVATERATGVVELRTAPIRNASVPLLLAWGSELQLTVGLEGLVANVGGDVVSASGVTLGALALAEVFGVDAAALGLTAAFRTSTTGLPLPRNAPPQLYLRFEQTF